MLYPLYYLVIVGLGYLSFWVDRRRFSFARFLTYTVAALAWAFFMRLSGPFAIVWAAVLGLNGQEWFLRRYGDRGAHGPRLERVVGRRPGPDAAPPDRLPLQGPDRLRRLDD